MCDRRLYVNMPQFSKILFLSTLLFIAVISSCDDGAKFEDTPFLEWRSYTYDIDTLTLNSRVNMTTYFTDGDGDIGRGGPSFDCETQFEAYINDFDMYVRYFEKVGGTFREIVPGVDGNLDSCVQFHNHLPDLTPEGQNKTLEGKIELRFNFTGLPTNAGVDSVRFELQLQDRSGNRSNVAKSPSIFIPE